MAKIGPGSHRKPHALVKIDKRTREAKLLNKIRADLAAHVGGKPSAVQQRMIERAAALHLRLAMLDSRMLLNPDITEAEMKTYLFWQNSYTRAMVALGVKGRGPADAPDGSRLSDIIGRAA